ncbi:MAG TPA: alkaline phosphatase family protein [Candidatus Aminicenantes bacterium]|nr:alkaline phosphatase family protein [Candidatus Aminicenantes bacterium]HRY65314.1 alkaline phosphatase family protein [Candidatus Aminicenantes bacterium]HRZ72218.1 alkaline phosphatase family protein [Candidatus Aminicenantes bacterium]
MPAPKAKKTDRACVIGLDGVPYGMIVELARRGVMSTMARLMDIGRIHQMRASLPEISSVSWTDFMTGTDSGTHGIFGFTDFKPKSYGIRFPNFLDVKAPTIWDKLGAKGKKSVIINQPSTYPARKTDGVLISGFVALELARAVWPLSYRAALEQMGYQIDIDILRCRERPELLWPEINKSMAGGQKAVNFFWEEGWDYFEYVVTATDRLHHLLWRAYEDPAHPAHQAFLDFYRHIDRLIGKIVAAYHKLTNTYAGFYILSDHGFCGIEKEVYLNVWLEKNGYLRFLKPEPESLEDIHGRSRAFALDPNRIYLNYRSKFPKGSVERTARRALKEEIASKLSKLEYQGRPVVRRVFMAEEVYSGPQTSKGPDLIVVAEPGFDMKGSVRKKEIFGAPGLQGMHTWDDAFFWAAEDLGDGLKISDVAPVILKNF